MTDERDPKVSRRYRELGGEEPPRELDQAILAAAHRAADKPHAPLVTPAGRHRWYFSLAAAAILVLAVALTVQVERQQPDPESAVAARAPEAQQAEPAAKADSVQQAPAAADQVKPAPKPKAAPAESAPPVFAPDPPAAAREEARSSSAAGAPSTGVRGAQVPDDVARAEQAPAESPAQQNAAREMARSRTEIPPQAKPAPAPATAPPGASADSVPRPMTDGRVMGPIGGQAALVELPERWLEQIILLRKEGKHDEADRALEEFRKRYPDYRIPESTLEKVEKR